MKVRTAEERAQFVKDNYKTCPYCHYNNERVRLNKYAVCLNCGKIIDKKNYFMIQLKKKMDEEKRRRG